LSAGVLVFSTLLSRPLRTSWAIVGNLCSLPTVPAARSTPRRRAFIPPSGRRAPPWSSWSGAAAGEPRVPAGEGPTAGRSAVPGRTRVTTGVLKRDREW